MADEIEIRPREERDGPRLVELFRDSFGMDVGIDYVNWKYEENPAGKAIGFVADAGERLAAFYGVIPEPWCVGGQNVTVFQSMDTMTHPDFQRRGLFGHLAERTYEELRKRTGRCDLVGIPGPNSYPALTGRLKWTEAKVYDPLVRPVQLAGIGRTWSRGSVTIEPVTGPDPRVSEVLRRSPSPQGDAWPDLSGRFFDWRVFGRSPKKLRAALALSGGEPIAVGVYNLTGPHSTMISYVASVDEVDSREWFGHFLRFTARGRSGLFYTWAPTRPALQRQFRRAGFVRNRLRRGPLSLRWPWCVRTDTGEVGGVPWGPATAWDLQPLTHD